MKINISQEDYEFLKHLQHELNVQENDGNAEPVYWVYQKYMKNLEEKVEIMVESHISNIMPENSHSKRQLKKLKTH